MILCIMVHSGLQGKTVSLYLESRVVDSDLKQPVSVGQCKNRFLAQVG